MRSANTLPPNRRPQVSAGVKPRPPAQRNTLCAGIDQEVSWRNQPKPEKPAPTLRS